MITRAVLGVCCGVGLLGACGKKKSAPPPVEPTVDAAVVAIDAAVDARIDAAPVEPWGPQGSCSLKMTGAKTFDQPEGQAAGVISWWFSEADRPPDQIPDTFLINCSGTKFQLTVGSRPHGGVMGPKLYTDDQTHDEMEIQAAIIDDSLVDLSGTLEVTAFDKHRLQAKVAVAGKLNKKGGKVQITGTIDYVCPGFSNCTK